MWLVTSLLPVLTNKDIRSPWTFALERIPIWALGGFLFGFFMWFFLGPPIGAKPKANPSDTSHE